MQVAIEQSQISVDKLTFVNTVLIPNAIAVLHDPLKVYPVSGKLRVDYFYTSAYTSVPKRCGQQLSTAKCGSNTVPTQYLSGKDQHGNTGWDQPFGTSTTYANQGGGC